MPALRRAAFPKHAAYKLLEMSVTVCLSGTFAARPTGAQQSPGAKCAAEAFHAFDYWAGTWIVRNAKGNEVGRSHVSRVSDGCAVLEQWSGSDGTTGTSINYYSTADSLWRQVWVGGGGQILNLSGRPADRVMTLGDIRESPQGRVMDRIRWIPRAGSKVEQLWEISTDGGKTWRTAFQGFYEPDTGGG